MRRTCERLQSALTVIPDPPQNKEPKMGLLIVQIGDIHIHKKTDKILGRCSQLANCIANECDEATSDLLFLFTGDYTQTGAAEEFGIAQEFIFALTEQVTEKTTLVPKVVTIPGNHDLDLDGDQMARDKLLSQLTTTEIESADFQSQVIKPLSNYWAFSNAVHQGVNVDWQQQSFVHRVQIDFKDRPVVLQLLNSAWMSQRKERANSLLFPMNLLSNVAQTQDLNPYVITVIHHPFNWYRQPDAMTQLRSQLELTSDLIVTGHEHGNDRYGKVRDKGLFSVDMLEGGVLQEYSNQELSTFNVLKFDFLNDQFSLHRFQFADGVYSALDDGSNEPIPVNRANQRALLTPTESFAGFLKATNLPISNDSSRLLSHQDIFTYPDLRERNDVDPEKPWRGIKGKDASVHIRNGEHCLVASDTMGGKTSLGKQLCLDSIAENRIAVFLKCNELCRFDTAETVRKWLKKQIEDQYGKTSYDRIVQNGFENTFAFVDDLHRLNGIRNHAQNLLEQICRIFGTVCVSVDTDYLMEESRRACKGSQIVANLRKLQICEFGYMKIEDLTRRWLMISTPDNADDKAVRKTCSVIERVLRINAIAHHPWVLIVLLQEATSSTELAAKNGSYGFLYQAVITCALAKSNVSLDIKGKYTYLSELAFNMYSSKVAALDLQQMKTFHGDHYKKFRITIDYDETISDFDTVGILRSSEGQVSFRDKYSYWFFVSWYLSENIHDQDQRAIVERLCNELHHEDSANILVFLSHFSNHPSIIASILGKARTLLGEYKPAELNTGSDLKVLDLVGVEELKLLLPTTSPEENRRRMLEEKDEHFASQEPTSKDGRNVVPIAPEPPDDEFQKTITVLRASLKAIDILGQVLRNGVGGITFERKLEIVCEIYLLARRFNGFVISDLPKDIPRWSEALNERFHEQHAGDSIAQRLGRITSHIVGSLSFLSYALARRVSHALAHEKLEEVFDETLKNDSSFPARMFDLSSRLDLLNGVPVNRAGDLYDDLRGNVIGRNIVRALVGNYLYLYRIDYKDHQSICQRLGIDYADEKDKLRPAKKKFRRITD